MVLRWTVELALYYVLCRLYLFNVAPSNNFSGYLFMHHNLRVLFMIILERTCHLVQFPCLCIKEQANTGEASFPKESIHYPIYQLAMSNSCNYCLLQHNTNTEFMRYFTRVTTTLRRLSIISAMKATQTAVRMESNQRLNNNNGDKEI